MFHLENLVEPCEINLQHSLMTFLTMLGSKANITNANIQTAVDNLEGLIQDLESFTVGVIHELCRDLGFEKSHSSVTSALTKINRFSSSLSSLGSFHKRNKWLSHNGFLIMPEELELGTREEQRSSVGKHSYSSVTVLDTYQFLRLEKLIPKLLENDAFVGKMDEHKKACAHSEFVTDFMCTDNYSKHEIFCKHPNLLILNMFIDAFETVNPLGSHTLVHKLEGLYCTIGNISPQYNSKTSSIFLISLWYAQDVKVYGYDKILEPMVRELQDLESDHGLQVLVHGELVTVHAVLSFFSADNLGANSLFGFMEGFTANKFCRFCKADKSEIQSKFMSTQFERRSKSDYEECVCKSLSDANYCASETGIKRGSLLNSLQFFHCTEQSIVDSMHDLIEGIVPLEISLVLGSLIDKQILSLDMVNRAILHYDYSLADRNSKPPAVSLPNIRSTASETWCLLRNLPLMIGSYIERGNNHWQLLILLLDCVNIIFAPAVTPGMIEYLAVLIQEHHTTFKELYPDRNLLRSIIF